jgi:hypothetical protein
VASTIQRVAFAHIQRNYAFVSSSKPLVARTWGDLLRPVAVHIQVPNILAKEGEEDADLLLGHAEGLCEDAHADALEVVEQIVLLPGADELEALILGPRRTRALEDTFGDGLETAVLKLLAPACGIVDGRPPLAGSSGHVVRELLEVAVAGNGAVVAAEDASDTMKLDPAARLQMPNTTTRLAGDNTTTVSSAKGG